MKIGFIYYNFYPVKGGASVHGYHLVKELSNLGYTLYKLNGEADPYTHKKSNPISGFLWILNNCDLIYIRMDYFLNLRNLIAPLAILAGKKIVVELNSPSDELHLFSKNQKQIDRADRRMAFILKRAKAVIAVSEPIKNYCEKKLGLNNVHLVENGGEVFEPDQAKVSAGVKDQIKKIRQEYSNTVAWAGSLNKMQDLELVKKIAEAQKKESAVLMIINEENENSVPKDLPENVFLFKNVSRDDVGFIITSSDIGLALYGDYSWSEWGFYNSSLKVYEYLNNGLLTISNKPGSAVQQSYKNFKFAGNAEEILTLIENYRQPAQLNHTIRTWSHVAKDTSNIIREIVTPQ